MTEAKIITKALEDIRLARQFSEQSVRMFNRAIKSLEGVSTPSLKRQKGLSEKATADIIFKRNSKISKRA